MNEKPPRHPIRGRFRLFDRWITPGANEIDGTHIDPKSMDVLVALVAAAPTVLSGQDLVDAVWPDVVVVPNVVYQTIAQLRKALGDDAHAPRYIETIPRRGYRVIAEIAHEEAPAAPSDVAKAQNRRHNLPIALTSFVGRERDLAHVDGLLRSHRLVTLTGVGGCGKTRLALALANARVDEHADGVWLVALAPLADAALVEPLFASALGVQPLRGLSLRDSLLVTLEDEQRLVVLDNCEHVIEACAELAEALLHRAPGLRILATSREPLGVEGERPWPIQPLAVPDHTMEPTVHSVAEFDSVRLFVERAGVSAPGFAPTPDNISAIARICRRLDGIPLALELAAARLRTLSVENIADRLAEDFRLLTGGTRTSLPHQRTLQASLDWSHALLPEQSRVLMRRLSVFANGFTLAAAEAVGGSGSLKPDDILDLLTRLVEQSMVQVLGAAGGTPRYRLLEPVRQYARGRLNDSGEAAALCNQHRDYFVTLGIELMHESNGGSGAGLYTRFEAEFDNFELALTRCMETDPQRGLRLALSTCKVAETAASSGAALRQGRLRLLEFLAQTPASAPWRAWALSQVSTLPVADLELPRRRELLEQAISLLRADAELPVDSQLILELACLTKLGMTSIEMGDGDEGARMIESALTVARGSDNALALATCLMNISWQGSSATESRADECVAAFRRSGNQVGLARALRRRCEIALIGESFEVVARESVNELHELACAQGNDDQITRTMVFVAILTEREGNLVGSVEILERSVERMPKGVWRNHYELGRALCQLGEYVRAESVLCDFLCVALKLLKPSRLVGDDHQPRSPYGTHMVQWLFATQPTVRQEQEWALALALLGLALIAGVQKQYSRAARLYGASMNFRNRLHFGIYATEKSLHDKIVPRIESALGANDWKGLRAEGAAMTVEQLTTLALLNERGGVLTLRKRGGAG